MLPILDGPMTTSRLRQELGIRLEAADVIAHLPRLLARAIHHRDDTTDAGEVAPRLAIPQALGDRRREVRPLLCPAAIRLLRDVAPRVGQGLLVLQHAVEVV